MMGQHIIMDDLSLKGNDYGMPSFSSINFVSSPNPPPEAFKWND